MHAQGTLVNTPVNTFNQVRSFVEQPAQAFKSSGIAVDLLGSVQLDYDDLVTQGKALHESDIARFDCPDLDHPSMRWGSAEYFRWYFTDGKKREAPLDSNELIALFLYRDRCSEEDAEHEVFLNSRAKPNDKEQWRLVVELGYLDWTREFAMEEYGVI